MHYDLLLFAVGQYPPDLQEELRKEQLPEFINLRHHDSVDRVSATTLNMLQKRFPDLLSVVVDDGGGCSLNPEEWFSSKYNAEIEIVKPETQLKGVENGFVRACRPNGSVQPSWDGFCLEEASVP